MSAKKDDKGKAKVAPDPNAPPKLVTEGKAKILFTQGNEVFYNPVQIFNRDLSIHVINSFAKLREEELKEGSSISRKLRKQAAVSEGFKILEALSATGLRAIRYAKEIPNVTEITANDIELAAVEAIKKNVSDNAIPDGVIKASHNDACNLMYKHKDPADQFHVVDLDPYGTPSMFLDGAVQAVAEGGLLCVTATDMAVLCGKYPEVSYAKYGAISLNGRNCHEVGLRIMLQSIQSAALRYKRYIVPLLSCSIDFYARVFVRVYTSPVEVKKGSSKLANVHQCIACDSWHLQPLGKVTEKGNNVKFNACLNEVPPVCDHCGSKFRIGGPIWSQRIHDEDFVKLCLKELDALPKDTYQTEKKARALLTACSEELHDCPLYYTLPMLSSVVKTENPPLPKLRAAFTNLGYTVTQSHACAASIKTDAPASVVWDLMRIWRKKVAVKELPESCPGYKIMKTEPSVQADFEEREERKSSVPRFLPNPEERWGPKARATGKRPSDNADDREDVKRTQKDGEKDE